MVGKRHQKPINLIKSVFRPRGGTKREEESRRLWHSVHLSCAAACAPLEDAGGGLRRLEAVPAVSEPN